MKYMKCLEQCLVHTKHLLTVGIMMLSVLDIIPNNTWESQEYLEIQTPQGQCTAEDVGQERFHGVGGI